jgi:N,N'-diacetyllegionaminate synthase
MNTITIGNKKIGENQPTFFIAEVACAHEGNFNVAKQMIDAAVQANADAIKFQIINMESYMVPAHYIYPIVQQVEFSPDQWKELRNYAREQNILFFADGYDVPSTRLAQEMQVDALKIHSSDLTNHEAIEEAAKTMLPLFLGVGATTMDEISAAIDIIKRYHNNIIIMHGYQAFPTKLEGLHFNFVKTLKEAYNLPIGVLDHTEGETFMSKVIPLLTPFVGAQVIEKHFVLDRSLKGIDYESSVNPDTLQEIVTNLRAMETTFGSSFPKVNFSEAEMGYRDLMKKAIVAEHDIPQGTILTREMLAFKRAGPGMRPMDIHNVVGKITKRTLQKHDKVSMEDIQ